MGYTYGEKLKITNDEVVLDNENVLTKLALSHGTSRISPTIKNNSNSNFRRCAVY